MQGTILKLTPKLLRVGQHWLALPKPRVILAAFAFLLAACAADPDKDESLGTCKIDCSKPKIGSSDMRIRLLTDNISLSCNSKDENYPNAVPLRFVVEKPRVQLPAETIYDLPSDDDAEPEKWTPVSGVGFYPLLLAGAGAVEDSQGRSEYNGVQTSPEQWCTDTCGIGALNVQPKCPGFGAQGDVFKLAIMAGGATKEIEISIARTTPPQ